MINAPQKTQGKFSRKALPPPLEYLKTQGIHSTGDDKWNKVKCPFHNDTSLSLNINIERGAYRCMVCGARGSDILAFHMHRNGLNFVEACKQLGAWVEGSQ
jgi:DNA primase